MLAGSLVFGLVLLVVAVVVVVFVCTFVLIVVAAAVPTCRDEESDEEAITKAKTVSGTPRGLKKGTHGHKVRTRAQGRDAPSSSSSLLLSDRRSESLFPSLLPLPELPSLEPVVDPDPEPLEPAFFPEVEEEDEDAAPDAPR